MVRVHFGSRKVHIEGKVRLSGARKAGRTGHSQEAVDFDTVYLRRHLGTLMSIANNIEGPSVLFHPDHSFSRATEMLRPL